MTSPSNDNSSKTKPDGRCPICEAPTVETYAPFCSRRCADVDLHRWLTGNYAVPATEDDSDGAAETEDS